MTRSASPARTLTSRSQLRRRSPAPQQAGTRLRIGFDFSYLQRLLQNVASEQIQFSLNDQTRAGVITPLTSDEGIDITALIIPMKLLGE